MRPDIDPEDTIDLLYALIYHRLQVGTEHYLPKVTIAHDSTWIKERQELLDADIRRTWS